MILLEGKRNGYWQSLIFILSFSYHDEGVPFLFSEEIIKKWDAFFFN
jgi:hypothetical protein